MIGTNADPAWRSKRVEGVKGIPPKYMRQNKAAMAVVPPAMACCLRRLGTRAADFDEHTAGAGRLTGIL